MKKLKSYTETSLQGYRTNNYLILYGDDCYFNQLDLGRKQLQLIETMRGASTDGLNILFGTIQDYYQAVMAENKAVSTFEGDFIPYISNKGINAIAWTGFYSSRPFQKSQTYLAHSLVRAAEIAAGLIEGHEFQGIESSNVLHHDAITGTCKPAVSQDYLRRIYQDQESSDVVIAEAYSTLAKPSMKIHAIIMPYKAFVIQNPVNWVRKEVIHLESSSAHAIIQINSGQFLLSQSVPFGDKYRIYFEITLESLSFTTVFMSEQNNSCYTCSTPSSKNTEENVSNGVYTVSFSEGLINKITKAGIEMNIVSHIVSYNASSGGAYIFRPMVTYK